MNRIFVLAFTVSLLVGFMFGWFRFFNMGKGNRIWGMYGIEFYRVAGIYILIGLVCLFFKKSRKISQGILLAGLLLLLLGQSICSGLIRF